MSDNNEYDVFPPPQNQPITIDDFRHGGRQRMRPVKNDDGTTRYEVDTEFRGSSKPPRKTVTGNVSSETPVQKTSKK